MVATSYVWLFRLVVTSPGGTFPQLLPVDQPFLIPQVQLSCPHLREASPDCYLLKPHLSHYNILLLSSRRFYYVICFLVSPLECKLYEQGIYIYFLL